MNRFCVGVIGFGSFGSFVSSLVPEGTTIKAFDKNRVRYPRSVTKSSFEEVAKCNVIFLCVPISEYKNVLLKLAKIIQSDQLLVDVCSVKLLPEQIINSYLPKHSNILFSHPLFGPQSFKSGVDQKNRLIITSYRGKLAKNAIKYAQDKLDLDVTHMSADEHDKLMADVHVLTFFIARGLSNMKLKEHKHSTPSYKMIMDLIGIDRAHSRELFLTIQKANPYASLVNKKIVKAFSDLEKEIRK
ncbi:MAG TPA: prephenate dehydrogenase/arogenate dehydrogenase family protein [Candidatus Saccharimonadales bacterium]|nr:prephenate dehydrogenase/arogenate dehydrogenase family protein [Candidatus Saccharimonadales bacterium]